MAWTLKALPPRMAEFLDAYLRLRDVAAACQAIKVPKPNGYRMMRDPRVKACIAMGEVPPEALDPHLARRAEVKATRRAIAAKGSKAHSEARAETRAEAEETKATIATYAPVLTETPGVLDSAAILQRLAMIADANAVDLFDMAKVGKTLKLRLKPLHEIPPALAYAISRIELMSSGTVKIHLLSKIEALRLAGQAAGTFRQGDEDDKPVGGVMADDDLTLEKRLDTYGNVIAGRFPGPPKSA